MKVCSEVRPWGRFDKFSENERCTVKLLYINSGSRLSLQYHKNRQEYWRIVKGNPVVQIQDKEIQSKEGEDIFIPMNARHRITAGESDCVVLELSVGEFDENDIVRIQDDYDRM
jgi:mannose-6-phosphate isomerase